VQRLAAAVQARGLPEVRDVVPALGGLALHFAPHFDGDTLAFAAQLVEQGLEHLPAAESVGRDIEVPVCYDEEFAPDLAEICSTLKMPVEEAKRRHAAASYRVLMIGFAPGHAYMGGLDHRLAVPRRGTPRTVVPAGSVAIANLQTVVYPYAIAGGWSIIGRTPLKVFDAARSAPSLFAAGDRVRFRPVSREEFSQIASRQ
jgi:inhibitor of KinA